MAQSFLGFCVLYFPHYLSLPPADFHPELLSLLEDRTEQFLSITGFRGSAKSSFGSVALPLWMALVKNEEYPFVVVINETRDVVVENMANVRRELEENLLLRLDFGDMSEGVSKRQEWTKTGLLLKNGVRVIGLSRGQRIRGRRHGEHRPSGVIIDDPEELAKVDKKEYRDKTERWLRGDVIPAIEETRARLIVMGNILHTDALMARLKNDPLFTHRDYALFKGSETWEHCTWKGKYPTPESLERQKAKVGNIAWKREYCLKIVPPEGQVVKEEWLQYYDEIPLPYEKPTESPQSLSDVSMEEETDTVNTIHRSGVGVDLAISKKDTADFTTMVEGVVAGREGEPGKLYILPHPCNERLSFLETQNEMKRRNAATGQLYATPTFYIEDVAYQRSAVEMAQTLGLVVVPVKPGADKRARLTAAATYIQNGIVKFPRVGAEDLIAQILGFGIEDHDDLVDGFTTLVLGMLAGETLEMPEIIAL